MNAYYSLKQHLQAVNACRDRINGWSHVNMHHSFIFIPGLRRLCGITFIIINNVPHLTTTAINNPVVAIKRSWRQSQVIIEPGARRQLIRLTTKSQQSRTGGTLLAMHRLPSLYLLPRSLIYLIMDRYNHGNVTLIGRLTFPVQSIVKLLVTWIYPITFFNSISAIIGAVFGGARYG